jgi:guanylate kinase
MEGQRDIICIVGESGSGKTTLVELLEKWGIRSIASYTTRKPRYPGEKHHTFVDKKGFDAIRKDLVAYTKFDKHEYGATRQQIAENHLYVIDPYGVEVLSENLGRDRIYVIYLSVSEEERLRRMTAERGEKAAQERITHDRKKFVGFTDFDEKWENENEYDRARNLTRLYALCKELKK